VANSAGRFAWDVDDWTRLRRFLALGSEGGSYYACEWKAARLIADYRLPREAVRSEHLTAPAVWDPLLADRPMTALVRSLATMTRRAARARVGGHGHGRGPAGRCGADPRRTVHPIALLSALRTYASGRAMRGRGQWDPVLAVIDALDAAFYAAFDNGEPTGRRLLLTSTSPGRWPGARSRACRA
jgi:60 kDa SS-A/Ro ribonucleoprotein